MNVNDAMREFRKAKDAIDTLDRYNNGEMPNIAEQHWPVRFLQANQDLKTLLNVQTITLY